jgi:hypothetical protein
MASIKQPSGAFRSFGWFVWTCNHCEWHKRHSLATTAITCYCMILKSRATCPEFRVLAVESRVKIGAPGEAPLTTQTCWTERPPTIPRVYTHKSIAIGRSPFTVCLSLCATLLLLTLFPRRRTHTLRRLADCATNVVMDRVNETE